ncbi:MAG: shikimate dehydrogenase [Bacteroidetes bacterium GWA2_31_9]|nr:MAG: shikimate dehydrogenase [Bacteroidetes bacterium GWA2_31_9]
MKLFGLVGFPLEHSFSKKYFTEKFANEYLSDCKFELFSIDSITKINDIILSNPNLKGFSVTIPYKEKIIPFLTDLDITASEIGAVNSVKVIRQNNDIQLIGYNTDTFGFTESLKPLLANFNSCALILGTGGAAKAVEYSLKKLNIEYKFVSRSKRSKVLTYSDLTDNVISSHKLIINSTPLGMFPKVENCPDIPYNALTNNHILFDLTYNPEITTFLKNGLKKNAKIKNGLEMLHIQAEKSWKIWNS